MGWDDRDVQEGRLAVTAAEDYRYLWDGSEKGWVLVGFNEDTVPLIYNEVSHEALIIEDRGIHQSVVNMMKENGKEVLSEIPPRNLIDQPVVPSCISVGTPVDAR